MVPAFNEPGNVVPLLAARTAVLSQATASYEIIIVGDGSTDAAWPELRDPAARDPHMVGISLSRNFGHQSALLAGLSRARGLAVIRARRSPFGGKTAPRRRWAGAR